MRCNETGSSTNDKNAQFNLSHNQTCLVEKENMFGCDIADFQTYDSDKVHIDNIDEIEEIIEAKKDCTPCQWGKRFGD